MLLDRTCSYPIFFNKRWCFMKKLLCFLLVIILGSGIYGCGSNTKKEYSSHEFLMDTIITITVHGSDEKTLKDDVKKAMNEFKRINIITNRFPEKGTPEYAKSEICKINENAGLKPVAVSDDVFNMVESSLFYGDMSGGAFNIAIGPIMDLWGFGSNNMHVPEAADISARLKVDKIDNIVLNKVDKTVFLKDKGMILDLGGVAKGYAAQKVADVLRAEGIKEGLIDAGGNIVVIGEKNNTDPWRIGITDPRKTDNYIGVLQLVDEAAVTSGDYQRNFTENGITYHHIINPNTGFPAGGTWSVTVISKDSGLADILSTTLFILGPEKGLDFIKKIEGVEAVFVGADKKIYMSEGIKDKFEITGNKYVLGK